MKRLFKRYFAPLLERSWLKGSVLSWFLAPLLWPVSQVVWYTWRFGRWTHPSPAPQKLPVPLLVIGNVYVGGVGKTPLVIALIEHCQRMGLRVGVVSRGYQAYKSSPTQSDRSSQTGQVKHSPQPHLIEPHDKAMEVGDEPLLIFKKTGAPVCIFANRYEAALHLLNACPDVQLIISDDGLQSHHLLPDMTICVFDDRGLGNTMTLPAGPLREPWPRIKGLYPSQLAPCQWVMNTGIEPKMDGHHALRTLGRELTNGQGDKITWDELRAPPTQAALALAGVARPELFFNMLKDQGVKLNACWALPDHADLEDFESVLHQIKNQGAPHSSPLPLICTEKDAVKLWSLYPQAFAASLELSLPEAFLTEFKLALHALMPTSTQFSNPRNKDMIGS